MHGHQANQYEDAERHGAPHVEVAFALADDHLAIEGEQGEYGTIDA